MIKRRVLVGLGACGWMPFASRGQAPTGNYILGYLGQGSKARMREPTHDLAVVLAHLKEQGFVEGRNLSVEARFAEGRFEDLSRLAHQLVQTKQFSQKKCPISGADFVKEQSAKVANVSVRFCCER